MSAEFLATMDIGEVDLDHRERSGGNRVTERDGIMSERAGVDHDAAEPFPGGRLDPAHQLAFVIRLTTDDPDTA